MKEELQSKLVEILTSIQTAAGKASDFAMEQLPDIAQSYVAFGRASTTLAVFLGVVLASYAVWALVKALSDDTDYRHEPVYGLSAMLAGALGVIFLIVNTVPMLMVWFAPKVWLLKEIASLLK